MDKSRQQFEDFAVSQGHSIEYFNGDYDWNSTRLAWLFWQASRENLEVELPYINTDPDYADPYTNGKRDGILEVGAVLNELGVTLK